MLTSDAAGMAGATLVFLIASGFWAERRFSAFARLPLHYGWSGEPTRFGARKTAIWLPTLILAFVAVISIVLPALIDPRYVKGDPETGAAIASVFLLLAQLFILLLHSRWARSQV